MLYTKLQKEEEEEQQQTNIISMVKVALESKKDVRFFVKFTKCQDTTHAHTPTYIEQNNMK